MTIAYVYIIHNMHNLGLNKLIYILIFLDVLVAVSVVTLTIDVRKSPKRYHKGMYRRGIERETFKYITAKIYYYDFFVVVAPFHLLDTKRNPDC